MLAAIIAGAAGGAFMGYGGILGDQAVNYGLVSLFFTYSVDTIREFAFYAGGLAIAFFGAWLLSWLFNISEDEIDPDFDSEEEDTADMTDAEDAGEEMTAEAEETAETAAEAEAAVPAPAVENSSEDNSSVEAPAETEAVYAGESAAAPDELPESPPRRRTKTVKKLLQKRNLRQRNRILQQKIFPRQKPRQLPRRLRLRPQLEQRKRKQTGISRQFPKERNQKKRKKMTMHRSFWISPLP